MAQPLVEKGAVVRVSVSDRRRESNHVVPLAYGTLCERGSKLARASRREVRAIRRRLILSTQPFNHNRL
ncbi:hypothetical protein [Nostoc favosum]|uniref:Uncharacterized protein n=1 Tax=Nostoc favosum CHAB5714 TaxID=2780399 RepID=A0ABS8I9E5_9NOSO|nr:hypothetical protein [Nostoc favosum]MCC5600738.1 hypothetical protein [Nostoc favosum CHAB5714]